MSDVPKTLAEISWPVASAAFEAAIAERDRLADIIERARTALRGGGFLYEKYHFTLAILARVVRWCARLIGGMPQGTESGVR